MSLPSLSPSHLTLLSFLPLRIKYLGEMFLWFTFTLLHNDLVEDNEILLSFFLFPHRGV